MLTSQSFITKGSIMGHIYNPLSKMLYIVLILLSISTGCSRPGTEKESKNMDNIKEQVQKLMDKLTLEDKLNMMDGDTPFWSGFNEMANGYNVKPYPAGVMPEIGVQGIQFIDGPRGIVMKGSTTFPVSMARGATWDIALEEKVGEAIGKELRAQGGNFFGGVCINLLRHPAWGRAQETYGEDPVILGEMGAALARGVQKHGMACVKHFALNSMENSRFQVDVNISDRALHEIYLPHFKRVIDKGNVAAVMSAYNRMNGEWCGQNRVLLTDILKNKWGFEGFVITDFIFGMDDSKKAVLAGQDIEMPFRMIHDQHLKELVEKGEVPIARIDDAVTRILTQQIKWAKPAIYDKEVIGCKEHLELAREVAEKSMVLLKNENSLLPLKNIKKLAVIGKLADSKATGDAGSSNTRPEHVVSSLEGIRDRFKDSAEIIYNSGEVLESAVDDAKSSDAVILIVGYTHEDEGEYVPPGMFRKKVHLMPEPVLPEEDKIAETLLAPEKTGDAATDSFSQGGDREDLHLHPADVMLIRAVAQANKNTVVSVVAGSAVIMEEWKDDVPAILMQWYSGMEGGIALANILAGDVNPGGKLPFVIPTSADHLPIFDYNAKSITYDLWHGYRKLEKEGNQPAFPFGFGLSYTNYEYKNLRLDKDSYKDTDTIRVTLDIQNRGKVNGEEIVQVYISAVDSKVERAKKELKAFSRIPITAGETMTVTLAIPAADIAYYDENAKDFIVEPVEYEVFAGRHSLDPQALKTRFNIK
jgi:beta-glucosidase